MTKCRSTIPTSIKTYDAVHSVETYKRIKDFLRHYKIPKIKHVVDQQSSSKVPTLDMAMVVKS